MKSFMLAGVAVAMMVMSGCISVEKTRAQLQSGDTAEIKDAEDTIYFVATRDFRPEMQIEYISLTSNNGLLWRIIKESNSKAVLVTAADKIDLSKKGFANELLTKHMETVGKVVAAQEAVRARHGGSEKPNFFEKAFAQLKEPELVKMLDSDQVHRHKGIDSTQVYSLKEKAAQRLLELTQDAELLHRMFDGDLENKVGRDGPKLALAKLAAMPDKITDKERIFKMLEARDSHSLENYVTNLEVREKLISKLNEDEAAKYVLQQVRNHSVYDWNKNKLLPLQDAIAVTKNIKNRVTLVRIVLAVASKIVSHEAECRSSMGMSWGKEDEEKAISLIKGLPKLNDKEITVLLCAEGSAWMYFMDSVSSDVAYDVLTNGKKKSGYLEEELIKKLPKNRLDMKVYNAVKSADAKNAVVEAMPENLKKQVAEAAEKAFSDIFNKAKAASKETFELDGFYLGMSFDDVKVVLAHHFPDWKIKEAIDGEGKDADHVIYVPGQSSPFCYAGVGDKKVYQFNFGKKMLKKWYKYDVQTFMEWANAYERETKIDMKFKLIEKDTTVYEPDMSRSYNVWFHQVSYQYKHNTKEYRLTYFGEEKDYTFHGGIGGAIIKGMAAKDFRYVRGDPGSLRAKIERD